MFDSIPTAAKARKQVEEMQSELGQKKVDEVSQAIQEAIDNLETSCTISGFLPKPLLTALKEEKGYEVQENSQKNEDYTYISW